MAEWQDPQFVESVAQTHKQYDALSKTLPSSQPGTSILHEDLQLSDSEESSDEQVAEKSPSSLAPPRKLPRCQWLSEREESSDDQPDPSVSQSRVREPIVLKSRLPPQTRVSQPPRKGRHKKSTDTVGKSLQKRKGEVEKDIYRKKPKLEEGTKALQSPANEDCHKLKRHTAEHRLEEAKKLKHQADAMADKTGRAFQYLDAALSYIEYGIALESDTWDPKSAHSVIGGIIDLLKFAMTLKCFTSSSASVRENIFAVLCMRCLALLHMAMFQYKKGTAVKYSKVLNEHFKNSSRASQGPSPCVPRSTGIGSSVTVPSDFPSITSSYINITSCAIYACDIWEHADALARKHKGFFDILSKATCTLALNSSMTQLVHYVRQGLQWLRLETSKP